MPRKIHDHPVIVGASGDKAMLAKSFGARRSDFTLQDNSTANDEDIDRKTMISKDVIAKESIDLTWSLD